jgi:hypothetical protein
MRETATQLSPGAYLVGAAPDAVHLSHEELRMTLLRALDAVHNPAGRSRASGTGPEATHVEER